MPRRRFGKKLAKSLLPILLVLVLALLLAVGALVYGVTHPPKRNYLVTPQSFSMISSAVLKVTDESWTNTDGTKARGWLLKGAEGAPAVVLLHRYGADRSWVFNLGVKINEAANFTILWPDLRGHGVNPLVKYTTFGGKEGDDVLSALNFLHTLKSDSGKRLVGNRIGFYGVELGGYAAMRAAPRDEEVKVLVLDSIPQSPDTLLRAAISENYGLDYDLLQYLARTATRIYLLGAYQKTPSCELASALKTQKVLLLSGPDAGYLRDSTVSLARCFPDKNVETVTDLPLTGFRLPSATGEQGEGYDRRVIEFFDRNLR